MITLFFVATRFLVLSALFLGVLLLSAGRIDFPGAWAWSAIVFSVALGTYAWLLRVNPGLVQERLAPPKGTDRDAATRRLVILPILGHLVLAGLDARLRWSTVPLAAQLAGLVFVASGFMLVTWVLANNPFASSQVRIQTERKQAVISSGPYRLVRHPMYLAVVLVALGSGIALGSWWASLSLVPLVAVFIRRTGIEDRMLHDELDGYRAYAERVRWRVVPLVY
ncbi:MAG: isoprenylcysteine carboxylmethyltransferase family protein [Archangium sp.]|nr:isoprenylcysteine carboxylmethyltransferase family protein [Archangium sp.]